MIAINYDKINEISIDYIYFEKLLNSNPHNKALHFSFDVFRKNYINTISLFIDSKIFKYKNFTNYYDLKQEAFEAVICSLKTFNPKKGCFCWWAEQYIKTRVTRSANSHTTIKYPMKIANKFTPLKVSMPIIIDAKNSPYQWIKLMNYNKHITKATSHLSQQHIDVLNMTYGLNNITPKSSHTILNKLGISKFKYIKLLKEIKHTIKLYFHNLKEF